MIELSKSRPRPPVVRRIISGLGVPIGLRRLYDANQYRKRLISQNQQQKQTLFSSSSSTTTTLTSSFTNLSSTDTKEENTTMDMDNTKDSYNQQTNANIFSSDDNINIEDERDSFILEDNIDNDTTGLVINTNEIDFSKKILHYTWHPFEDIVAIAGLNNLYLYHT